MGKVRKRKGEDGYSVETLFSADSIIPLELSLLQIHLQSNFFFGRTCPTIVDPTRSLSFDLSIEPVDVKIGEEEEVE